MIKTALIYSFSSKYLSISLQIVTTLVLARILTPEHIGLYTVASIVTGFIQMFRDFGVSDYIIKTEKLDESILSAAFSTSILIAWPLALLLNFLSPLIGDFYGDEIVGHLIMILSLNLFLAPFGSIQMALMRKKLNYKPISYSNICNVIVNSSLSVLLAMNDCGAISLAVSSVAGTLVTVISIYYFSDSTLKFSFTFKGLKKVAVFGANVGAGNIINYISHYSVDMCMGKSHSLSELGQLSRGKSTVQLFSMMVTDAIMPLISPYFAAQKQSLNTLGEIYTKTTKLYCYLVFPFTVGTLVASDLIILLLYGEQWLAASFYLKYLSVAFLFSSFTVFFDQLLLSQGMVTYLLKFRVAMSVIRIILAASIFYFDIEVILTGLVFVEALRFIVVQIIMELQFNLKFRFFVNNLIKPMLGGLVFTAAILPYYLVDISSDIFSGLLILIAGVLAWSLYMIKFDNEFLYETGLIQYISKANND
ncbi:MAG: lipopolysaccharide biosynthesis protein [Calditrichaeota bacterium]|nr:lipopolysaccharide biosynthesis protein [Calditrichota bacterium]